MAAGLYPPILSMSIVLCYVLKSTLCSYTAGYQEYPHPLLTSTYYYYS
jgi:hypothetical protein